MSYLAKQLKEIKPASIGLDHGAITFTDNPKYKYKIISGLYNGYPIVTDNLYGTLVTLFREIQEYIDDLYRDLDMDEEERDQQVFDALVLSVNNEELEIEESDLACDEEPLLGVNPVSITDICGSNFGSGIYVGG